MRQGSPARLRIAPLVLLLLACATAAAQETRPSVLDLYRLAPASALFPEGLDPDRDAVVAVRDVANGYLRLEGAWEGFTEVALFRAADGTSLLVTAVAECGPLCRQSVLAFALRDGALVDVTADVLPPLDPDRLAAAWARARRPDDPDLEVEDLGALVRLPRHGTTIRVVVPEEVAGREVDLLELRWDRRTFELEDAADRRCQARYKCDNSHLFLRTLKRVPLSYHTYLGPGTRAYLGPGTRVQAGTG